MRDLREIRRRGESHLCAIGVAIAATATIGAAVIGGNATKSAAKTAANTQLQMYQQTRQDLAPYMTTGTAAMDQIAKLWGLGPGGSGVPDTAAMTSALQNFPGYQFGLNQGVQALDRSASARGMVLSGAQLQDAQTFGQNYAMQQGWQPYVSMLSGLSNLGENAAAGAGNSGAAAAAGAAQSQLAGGQAAANQAAGIGNGIQSVYQGWQNRQAGGFSVAPSGGYNTGGFSGVQPSDFGDFSLDPPGGYTIPTSGPFGS